jgi:predicted transcriptional regulator
VAMQELREVVSRDVSTSSRTLRSLRVASLILSGTAVNVPPSVSRRVCETPEAHVERRG